MKMKNNTTITCFADLDREETRVKKRIKKQEEALKIKFKSLPEEIVTTGITKLVTGIINGDVVRSIISIVKTIGAVFTSSKNDKEGTGNGILNIIKTIVNDAVIK